MKLSELQEHIDSIVKESLMEYMPEPSFAQFEKEKSIKDDEDDKNDEGDDVFKKAETDNDNHNANNDKVDSEIEAEVMKWLDSAQQLHSVLSYDLFPDMTDDAARSYFSKKWRGVEGKSFNDKEINRLYDLKDKYIQKISEAIKRNLRNYIK